MTHPDDRNNPLGDYIDTFGERYADATRAAGRADATATTVPSRRRARRLMPALGIGSVAATGAVVYAFVALPVGDRIDAVQSASAALGTANQILHYETKQLPDPDRALPKGCTQADIAGLRTQVWQTTSGPTRWHELNQSPTNPACAQLGPDGRQLTGDVEIAQHGTVYSLYMRDLNLLSTSRVKDTKPTGPEVIGSTEGSDSRDFVVTLRDMLRTGKMKVAGAPHEVDGRKVLTLESRSFHHYDADKTHPNLDLTQVTSYDVDADSFTPLKLTRTDTYVRDGGPYKGTYTSVFGVIFTVYERLPKTPENEKLLSIQTAPGARSKIPRSEKTAEQIKQDEEIAKYEAKRKAKLAKKN